MIYVKQSKQPISQDFVVSKCVDSVHVCVRVSMQNIRDSRVCR